MTTNIPNGAPAEYMNETWRNKMGLAGAHEMFRNMVDSCFKKCTEYRIYHHEGSIGSGEGHCLDRCILKYTQAQVIAGSRIKRHTLSLF